MDKLERQLNYPLIHEVDGLRLEDRLLDKQESEMARIVKGEFLEVEKHLLKTLLQGDSEELIDRQREYEIDEDLLFDTPIWQIDGLSQLCILSNYWAAKASLFDFCISVLKSEFPMKSWDVYQSITQNCGLIYPYEKVGLICTCFSGD